MMDWIVFFRVRATIVCCGLVLLGCTTTTQVVETENRPEVSRELIWQLPSLKPLPAAPKEHIFALSITQKEAFRQYFHAPENQHIEQHKRLYNYLEHILSGFDYRGDTLNAQTALDRHGGNCMSLAIVTSALANLVDIEVRYQRVNSAPIYQRFSNVMTLSSHVRSHVYAPKLEKKKNQIVLIRPKLVIDYFPESTNVSGQFISHDDFYSMYYQNLAGDALVQKNYGLAYGNLIAAMEIDATNPETLNTLAVLHRALGYDESAEKIYKFALEETPGSVNLLSNYAFLLERQDRKEELKLLEDKLATIEDDNPYRWYDIANRQFGKQNYAIALKYFKRSVEVAPYMHEGYFGLAKTYYQIGLLDDAAALMEKASKLAFTPKEEYLYRAKLKVLSAKLE